jgi:hypothetical protein
MKCRCDIFPVIRDRLEFRSNTALYWLTLFTWICTIILFLGLCMWLGLKLNRTLFKLPGWNEAASQYPTQNMENTKKVYSVQMLRNPDAKYIMKSCHLFIGENGVSVVERVAWHRRRMTIPWPNLHDPAVVSEPVFLRLLASILPSRWVELKIQRTELRLLIRKRTWEVHFSDLYGSYQSLNRRAW